MCSKKVSFFLIIYFFVNQGVTIFFIFFLKKFALVFGVSEKTLQLCTPKRRERVWKKREREIWQEVYLSYFSGILSSFSCVTWVI